MSELQLALLGVAVILLLAVYVGGKWQERALLRRLRERLQGGVGDPLLVPAPAVAGPLIGGAPGGAAPYPRSASADALGRLDSGGAGEPGAPAGDRADDAPDDAAGGARHGAYGGGRDGADAWADGSVAASVASMGATDGRIDGGPVGAASRESAGAADPNRVISEPLPLPSTLLRPDWVEDPLIDCSLEIRCARAVDGVRVIEAASALAHAPWKLPVHFVVWDGLHQQWVLPDRFGYYTDALASIQLADRHHRLDEEELARFVQVVQQVAAALDADVDVPDAARLLEQAAELDALCARFDVKIGLTVESTGATWTGPQLRSAAQHAGFAAVRPQHWVRCDEQGEPLYAMQADAPAVDRVALELDIAVAPIAARALHAMVQSAAELAQTLGGRVVDDNGQLIDLQSMDAVEHRLVQLYEEMRQAGIEPGGTRARRLYA
jgi:hypothetical protein